MQQVIQLTVSKLLTGLTLFTVIQWILAKWFLLRLENSIQHEYDKKMEDYRFQQLQRQKAETVARLFAKWIKYRGKEKNFLNKLELINYYEELNQMSFELSIWIEDVELITNIMARLALANDSKDIRALTADVRRMVLKSKEDGFDPIKIIIWPTDEVGKEIF